MSVPGLVLLPGMNIGTLPAFGQVFLFKIQVMKIQIEIDGVEKKDNEAHTGPLELPSSSC